MADAHVTISPRAPASCDVAICGGGLGGLALAAGLVRRGYDVHVFGACPPHSAQNRPQDAAREAGAAQRCAANPRCASTCCVRGDAPATRAEAAPQLRTATSTLIGLGGNSFNALSALHPDIVPKIR